MFFGGNNNTDNNNSNNNTEILPTKKGIVDHCYTKHRYSAIKGKCTNEITAGTTARSSVSGRDTPAVDCYAKIAWLLY